MTNWNKIASKSVFDIDGFTTDYTWYYNIKDGIHIFIFGDNDIYNPTNHYYDWIIYDEDFNTIEDAKEEAYNWFYYYRGYEAFAN